MSRTRRFWYNKTVYQRKGLCLSSSLKPYQQDKRRVAVIRHDWCRRNDWRRKIRMMNKTNMFNEIYEPVIEYKNVYFD